MQVYFHCGVKKVTNVTCSKILQGMDTEQDK
jgi:hypothetical protein